MSFKNTPPASAKLTFPCSECAFEAQSARQLSRHKAVTHTQNALKCVLCPFVTAYQTNLLRHRKDVHGICGSKGNKSCKFCGFVSEDNDTLIQHQIEYHQDILKSAQVKFAKELVSAGGDETFADFEAISQEFMRNKNLKKINLSKKQKKQKVKHNLNYEIKPKTNIAVHNEENNEFDEFWKAGFIDQYEEQEIYYNQPSLANMDMQNESLNNSSRSSTPKSQSSHNLNIKDLPATRIRRQYSCNDCGFRTVNPREFLYHRRDGHGYRIKIVECPYCVYACQYVQKLQRHLFLVHKLNVSPEMTSSAEVDSMVVKRKYKKSQLAFNGNSILDSDIKHGDKDVSNDDGDYDQPMNDVGIEHMNNFEMNLNEYCNDDGNNSKDAIDDNEDDPNYQMNLQCSICKIKFGDIVSAQKHFIKYHKYGDSKSYVNSMDNDYSSVQMTTNQKKVFDCIKNVHTCNYCGYKTRWISELERHVRVHSKEKPFKCMFCDFKSKWKGDLNRHIQRYHSNEPTLPEIESDANVSGNPHSTEMSPPTCLMSRQDDETSNDINDSFSPDNDIANDYPNSYECLMQVDDEEFNAAPNTIDSGDNFDADNEDDIQSPNNNTAKMYKCTYCDFMCNTASRFHVHYVQHLNTKPFQCSICGHRSNWEWDVTKHIKMKAQRDPSHEKAQPVLIHDSGKRDYSKYNKFVIWVDQADAEMVNNDSNKIDFRAKRFRLDDENNGTGDSLMAPEVCFEVDGEMNYNDRYNNYLPKRAILARYKAKSVVVSRHCNSRDQAISCLECDFKHKFARVIVAHMASHFKEKPYTCKYCHFDTNWREVIINHYNVEHENIDNMDFAMRFRCIIDQNSICRIISVEELVELEATSSVAYESPIIEPNSSLIEPNIYEEKAVIRCELCPFLTTNFKKMTIHCRFHNSLKGSLKCKYCPYYVNNKDKLIRHQKLHQNVDTSNLIVDGTDSISNYQQPTYGQRPTMISCSLCPFQTKNSQSLNEHMKIHDATAMDYENDMNEDNANPEIEATENRVNECDNTNNDLNQLQFQTAFADNSSSVIEVNGMKNGNAKKFSYICTECPAAFKSPGDYKIHAVFHSSDYQHSCPYCTYKARTKPQLCKHLYVHTAEYISKRANSYPDGTKHTVGNQETSQVISQQSSSTTLKKKTSAKQKQPKSGRKQRTKFQFPMKPVKVKLNSEENGKQNIVFNNTGLMANQEFLETKEYLQRIHSGIKNRCMYRCSNCPAVFTKVNTLIYHMTLHDQKDQFTCETCNYSTTTEDNLSIHSLLHNLTESQTAIGYNFNYNCHKCPAGFSKRSRLEKHLSLHGEKFNWKCDKCDYSVRYAATLVKHRALHLINPNFQAADTVNGADLVVESVDKPAAIDEAVAVDSKTNLKLKLNFSKLRQNENAQGKLKMTLNIPESKDNLENPLNHDAEVEDSGDDFEDEAIPQLVMADETEQVAIESN